MKGKHFAGLLLALPVLLAGCGGGGGGGTSMPPPPPTVFAYSTWAASPQLLDEAPPGTPGPAHGIFNAQTVRQVAHLSMGGTKLKVKLSNLFGTVPVTFNGVHVARSTGSSSIDASTDRAVTFGGLASFTAAAGTEFWSDDVDLPVARGGDVAVSIYIASSTPAETGHTVANASAFVASGDGLGAAAFPNADVRGSNYWLSEIAASGGQKTNVVVAFGDSITEGTGSTFGANLRYPDQLSARLASETNPAISVVNAGIGGNRWVFDFPGPSGMNRFDRDVLGVQGVTHAIVLLGINDLEVAHTIPAQHVTAAQLIAAAQGAVAKAQARGVKVLLGTLLPYKGSFLFDPADEAIREEYNAWIRSQSIAGIVDFEAALRDPADPLALAPQLSSPDHLHPNDAGYAAMAALVDVTKLR
ncbi:MAG: GDSL-type esterase/lipase family protein [Usitatibacter sp.]